MIVPIRKLVVTGGPCAGKSKSMDLLVERFTALGYLPLVVPEAATILMNSGVKPHGGEVELRAFQESVFELILTLEAAAVRYAKSTAHPKPIILCDRGLMDSHAYMTPAMFQSITTCAGLDMANLRDARYEAVFHLRTAAFGAEEHYTLENNPTRYEDTIEKARATDERTLAAWLGHPSVSVVGNNVPDFNAKLELLWKHVLRVLGEHEIERRFLVAPVDLAEVGVPHKRIPIEQHYVSPEHPGTIRRVRKRHLGAVSTYHETMKSHVRIGVANEHERMISAEVYEQLRALRLDGTRAINKYRHCFVYRDQYFELDQFAHPHEGLFILEVELLHENDAVEIPPFLTVIEEVTGNKAYANYALATKV